MAATALKQEIIGYVNSIPDDLLLAVRPLLEKLSHDLISIEAVDFDDLTESEKQASLKAVKEYHNRETVSHDEIDWD